MDFTLHDLGLAFRKAKVDIYYSSHASLLANDGHAFLTIKRIFDFAKVKWRELAKNDKGAVTCSASGRQGAPTECGIA